MGEIETQRIHGHLPPTPTLPRQRGREVVSAERKISANQGCFWWVINAGALYGYLMDGHGCVIGKRFGKRRKKEMVGEYQKENKEGL